MMFFYESVVPYVLIAFAIGMDAFSVSLTVGMTHRRLRWWLYFVVLVGAFHVMMPLAGIGFGEFLSEQFGQMAQVIGGWMLVVIGIQMVISTFWQHDLNKSLSVFGLMVLAFTVSLDSFSVGVSIGMIGAHVFVIAVMFGLVSMVLSWFGLMLARHSRKWFGVYSEAFGGLVLTVLGLQMVW
ncbi:putative Mn2+ efflux pump MntP [Alkalibacillus salilacus]|uniref:Mn2+ efflux pump MntP n=2 Tax=Alkalibacillus salilacus TaxID=284582 RepID=A0ABT9VI57_9BACI|nr:putative Mn2+ efflux pump MntP [Alkalibacillus salilacus]